MANELGQLSAKVSLDTIDFNRNLAAMKRDLKTTDSALKLAGKGVHGFGESVSKGEAQMKYLGKAMRNNQQQLKEYKDRYAETAAGMSEADRATSKRLQLLQNDYLKTQMEMQGLAEEYKKVYIENGRAQSGFYQTGDALEKFGTKLESNAKKVGQFADKWSRVGVVVGLATGLVVKQAIEWESAVASMSKTIDEADTNPQMFKALTEELRDMSLEIPVAAKDLAELAATAGQLGIKTPAIAEFTKTMAALGVSTNITAENAASQLARFANITGMSQDKFDELGSSIVDLGNNFATTEDEIVNMSLRLAGAGSSVGLTEAEILGLSTTLSSLGVEAEAGGSSMSKLLVNIQLATQKGGKELEDFAKVAGMSADDFAKSFGDDPMTAIISFVEGLGEIDKNGGSVISTLDEMGITEIRMRDALLRLAGGSDLLSDAVNTSTTAWEENTALTTEAEKRYGTTASQLQLLKNEVTDMAIDLGTALIPVLLDFVNMAKPVIGTVKDMITSFSESSDGTKKFVGALLGFTIVGGPILKVFAGMAQGVGLFSSVLGKGMKGIVNYRLGLEATKASTTLLTGATATASGSAGLGGMTASAGLATASMSPLVVGIGLVVGALALGYAAWKLWGEELNNNRTQMSKWGTVVDTESDKALTRFQDSMVGMEISMNTLADGIDGNSKDITGHVTEMVEEVERANEKLKKNNQKLLEDLPEQFKEAAEKKFSEEEKAADKSLENVKKSSAAINKIYEKASNENRELTADENVFIANKQLELQSSMLDNLGIFGEQRKTIEETLGANITELTVNQALKRAKSIKGILDDEQKSYEKQRKSITAAFGEGTAETEKYLSQLEESHNGASDAIIGNFIELMQQGDQTEEQIRQALGGMGIDYEAYEKRVDSSTKKIDNYNGQLIQSTKEMTAENKAANELWNGLIWDEEKAEIKTNTKEAITEWVLGEKTWDNINLLAKDANLDTNARKTLLEVLVENGKWDMMDWNSKSALIETNSAETAYKYLANHGQWENMTFQEKMAILNSNTPETVRQALIDKGVWDQMSPKEQKLVMSSNAKTTVSSSQSAVASWDKTNPKTKNINVESNAQSVANSAQSAINNVEGKTVYIRTVRQQIDDYQTIKNGGGSGPFGSAPKIYPRGASGRNFTPGGQTLLGDAGNHEPFLTPEGQLGLSDNKDTIYDLPRGTKVWRNIEALMNDLPKFANGTMNAPIKVGDNTFRQLTDALVPFSAPSFMQGNQNARGLSSQTPNIEGDTYNVYLTANGELPRTTIRKMADLFQQEIKNKNDRKKMSRGEVVTY